MNDKKINILTRTSSRPNYFRNCINSVNDQTYKNINHIISVDDDNSEKYVQIYTTNYIKITNIDKKVNAPYNLYLNELNEKVTDGWIMYLDDDDIFMNNTSLENIVKNIQHEDQLLLWKVKFPSMIIPENTFWGKTPQITHISMIGFMYHSKYKNIVKFDGNKCADYRYISALYNIINDKVWISDIHTTLQRTSATGGYGSKDDLKK